MRLNEEEEEKQEQVNHKLNVIRSTILGTEELIEPIKEELPERTQQEEPKNFYDAYIENYCLDCKQSCCVHDSKMPATIKLYIDGCARRNKRW